MELTGVLALQAREGEAARVVNADIIAGGPEQNHVAGFIVDALGKTFLGRQNGRLGCLKDAIEPPHHDKGEDHLAVFGLLEVAAQDVGNRPDERAEVLNAGGCLWGLIHNTCSSIPSRLKGSRSVSATPVPRPDVRLYPYRMRERR